MSKKKQTYSLKRTPTYQLEVIKNLIREGKVIPPGLNVQRDINAMNFTIEEAYGETLELEREHFQKSNTQPYDHTVWQDAYVKEIRGKRLYIKFKTFQGKFLLTSFKPDKSQEE